MNTRKNYNSIVFLAAFFGLVLVGATPQVLAQAAMTRQFDIKTEIEFKDDLDKKPDDDVIEFSGSTGGYFDDLEDLIEDLQKLHRIEKFNLNFDTFHFKESQVVECNLETIRRAVITSKIDEIHNNWITPAIVDATNNFENYAFLGDCAPSKELNKKKGVNFELETVYDKESFKFALTITKETPQKAKQLLEKFNQAYNIYKLDEEEVIIKKIYENTTYSFVNNQVFVVTRLPRAAIDELFAENAR